MMQLLHEHKPLLASMTMNNSMTMSGKLSAEAFDVKEKGSSLSVMPMNPVASGDSVTVRVNSSHKLKDELPPLLPCCEGRELLISEDLVKTGLSAISMKHDGGVIHCVSMSHAMDQLQFPPGLIKHRNSFRCLHRPDLKRVPYLRRMTPDELETLFRGYSGPGRTPTKIDKEDGVRVMLPPGENIKCKETKESPVTNQPTAGVDVTTLHAIPEARSGSEDVPAGMRLHGARARLYTSVLAGVQTGDRNECLSATDEYYDLRVHEPPSEDETILMEELQIILPPRCDDVNADSTITTSDTTR